MSTATQEPQRKGGRPKLPPEQARGIFEKLRVNERELEAIKRAAEKNGVERSEWMRRTLMEAAAA